MLDYLIGLQKCEFVLLDNSVFQKQSKLSDFCKFKCNIFAYSSLFLSPNLENCDMNFSVISKEIRVTNFGNKEVQFCPLLTTL